MIVQNYESSSRVSAGFKRVHAVSKALLDVSHHTAQPRKTPLILQAQVKNPLDTHIKTVAGDTLALSGLTVFAPNCEQVLIKDLSVRIEAGQGLLVVGLNGAGKSSLLRVIAGLCKTGRGTVTRPGGTQLMLLSQQAYFPRGSLRCQLTYPQTDSTMSDVELLEWLDRVNLPTLVRRFGGLDATLDWPKLLSVGEQQRLAFARALIAKPRYLLLDESTSALDAGNEDRLYQQLGANGITPISVGHRLSIARHHSHILKLHRDSSWTLVDQAVVAPMSKRVAIAI